jgi:hypothetical protein
MVALVLGACTRDDITSPEPVDSAGLTPSFSAQQLAQQETPDPMELAHAVPGFAGYFLDDAQRPTVYLTDVNQRAAAELALAGWLSSRGFTAASLQVRQARYDWIQLDAWYDRAWTAALSVSGAVFSDVDEGNNRLRFGGDLGAVSAIAAAVAGAGVPGDAFVVEQASPIALRAHLQTSRVRPVSGGYQINFLNAGGIVGVSLLCTLGFNAISELPPFTPNRSYVTNAHCTGTSGDTALLPMDHYQPLQDSDGDRLVNPENFIGSEVDDPSTTITLDCVDLLEGVPRLPGPCRWSDAARGEYADGVPFELGKIARPAAFDPVTGTLEVDPTRPTFQIVKEQPFPVLGETVNKVGRTTGWTGGLVTGTCIDIITDDHFIRRCQATVAAGSAGGDSGSPVFAAPNRRTNPNGKVILVGILWGGSIEGEPEFVYSPMHNVERELGPLKTF